VCGLKLAPTVRNVTWGEGLQPNDILLRPAGVYFQASSNPGGYAWRYAAAVLP